MGKIFNFFFKNCGDHKLIEESLTDGVKPTKMQKWEIPPMENPVFVISEDALNSLKKGKPEEAVFPYYIFLNEPAPTGGEVYPSMDAAIAGIATRGNKKFYILEITKHICTEIIVKQDCQEQTMNFTQEIIRRLKAGQKVSALKAAKWPNCPSTKLTSRMGQVRAKGYKVKQKWRTTAQGKRFMEYWL